jgi:endonuclease G
MAIRFIVFMLLLVVIMSYLYKKMISIAPELIEVQEIVEDPESRHFLPTSNGYIVNHKNYSLSYREDHEQAEWVAYKLTRNNLKKPNVSRTGRFNPDYDVKTRSAYHRDYTGSGYTRGHLAPAGDMAHNIEAMQESFLMSNISPQLRSFNNGIWKELEEQVRDWAFSAGELYVVTGPVLTDLSLRKIGENKVSVPDRFYKVVLDLSGKKERSAAFLIPNSLSTSPLSEYSLSIDSIEALTGIDFFNDLLNEKEEDRLESINMVGEWKFSDKRFQLRVNKWNHQ